MSSFGGLEAANFNNAGIKVSGKNRSMWATAYNRGAKDTVAKNKDRVSRAISLAMQDAHAVGVEDGRKEVLSKVSKRPAPVQRIERVNSTTRPSVSSTQGLSLLEGSSETAGFGSDLNAPSSFGFPGF